MGLLAESKVHVTDNTFLLHSDVVDFFEGRLHFHTVYNNEMADSKTI